MPSSDAPITISREELSTLEDLTRELCNLMTVLLYHVDLLPANRAAPEFDRMMIITGVVTKTEQALKELLVIFGRIQDSAGERASASKAGGA
jgi:hypothetical protein